MGNDPVEEDGDGEGDGRGKGEVISALVVWVYGCRSGRVFNERWDILKGGV